MPILHVYSRPGCHLCELLIEELLPLVQGQLVIEVRDVDQREEWRRAYDIRIPVVEFEGEWVFEHKLDRAALQAILDGLAHSTDC